MSKERQLLKRIVESHYHGSSQLIVGLKFEIEEILAQPEPEPTTDKQTSVSMAVMTNGVSVSNVYDAYEAGRASVMVESEPETLTPRQGLEEYKKGYAQAEQDLKREPLSDEDICEILLKKEWKGFVELTRQIEKEHGIGDCDEQ